MFIRKRGDEFIEFVFFEIFEISRVKRRRSYDIEKRARLFHLKFYDTEYVIPG